MEAYTIFDGKNRLYGVRVSFKLARNKATRGQWRKLYKKSKETFGQTTEYFKQDLQQHKTW